MLEIVFGLGFAGSVAYIMLSKDSNKRELTRDELQELALECDEREALLRCYRAGVYKHIHDLKDHSWLDMDEKVFEAAMIKYRFEQGGLPLVNDYLHRNVERLRELKEFQMWYDNIARGGDHIHFDAAKYALTKEKRTGGKLNEKELELHVQKGKTVIGVAGA